MRVSDNEGRRKRSTIITSNRSVKDWVHGFAGDQMATTAILDRLFHRAHLLHIDGKRDRLRDVEKQLEGRNLAFAHSIMPTGWLGQALFRYASHCLSTHVLLLA